MDLANMHILAYCFIFPLRGVDLVVGIAWLQTLGELKVNWLTMVMTSISASQLHKLADIEYSVLLWQRPDMEKFCLFDTEITEFQHI